MPAFENMARKMLCAGRGAVVSAGEVNKKNWRKVRCKKLAENCREQKNAALRELVTMMKAHGFSSPVSEDRPWGFLPRSYFIDSRRNLNLLRRSSSVNYLRSIFLCCSFLLRICGPYQREQ